MSLGIKVKVCRSGTRLLKEGKKLKRDLGYKKTLVSSVSFSEKDMRGFRREGRLLCEPETPPAPHDSDLGRLSQSISPGR